MEFMPEIFEKIHFLKVHIIENSTISSFITFLCQHLTSIHLNFYLANVVATNC